MKNATNSQKKNITIMKTYESIKPTRREESNLINMENHQTTKMNKRGRK
jgi:hypothetical protein